jgi:hypothetical protein
LNDPFVDGAFGDETVNSDLACLAQPMGAIHSLGVIRRIPVVIIEDHRISSSKINPQAPGTRAQQKYKNI